jgi:hypothetical protein
MKRTALGLALTFGLCSAASAQQTAPDWQTVTEPAPGEALALRHLCRRISPAEAATTAPLPLDLTVIPPDAAALRDLGAFGPRARGVEIRSRDPRFAALEIAPGRVLPRLPNGDSIQVDGYAWAGSDSEPARCFAPWNPTDLPDSADVALVVPAQVRARLGARPDLRLIGAAPLGGGAWLALTAPEGEGGRSVLVQVSADAAQDPQVVAELPFAFQIIQPLLDPHGVRRWVRLVGRGGPDEPIRVVVLEAPAALR